MSVDMKQPKPLVTLRRATVLFVFVVVLVVFGPVFLGAPKAQTNCHLRDSRHETRLDFTFIPPGYDCVYFNDGGQEVERVRAR